MTINLKDYLQANKEKYIVIDYPSGKQKKAYATDMLKEDKEDYLSLYKVVDESTCDYADMKVKVK